MQNSKIPRGLYGITPEWDDIDKLIKAVYEASKGGMQILQLRRKKTSYDTIKKQAVELIKVCADLDVKLIINDFWKLALELGADGFHLGLEDCSIKDIEEKVKTGLIVGTSCYNDIERAKILVESGVDYIAFGAVFPSITKPLAPHVSLNILKTARSMININTPYSIVAIGGITVDKIPQIIESDIDNIAVINGLFESENIFNTAQKYSSAFNSTKKQNHDE
ncbi:thiamine-phosphate pyrophosphorylase [Candidatus Kinetoplastibacterium desouzaii TCC079E]|uniref:Thiamine-phosphate synthase n=1 Tax=Candidatus Kinetoplastidibacterium desouzai TCC079E TaxID=1208919 RepID=M1LV82_9PROT|nr:thiamine phosphate synthase [Candidatus Kinetoplastibacterium desouzaii]AGF47174.1 thiamine-phosphate pyrophosphorylase [Candidatus Kinetoplastibacterium desouzaii TCC079E]